MCSGRHTSIFPFFPAIFRNSFQISRFSDNCNTKQKRGREEFPAPREPPPAGLNLGDLDLDFVAHFGGLDNAVDNGLVVEDLGRRHRRGLALLHGI